MNRFCESNGALHVDGIPDFEKAAYEINTAFHELEQVVLNDQIEGVKVLEFFLSFNPAIFDQNDLSIKIDAWRPLNGHCQVHARTIVEQSLSFDIPVWKTYREKIQKVIDRRREIFAV